MISLSHPSCAQTCGSESWEDSRGLFLHPLASWQNQPDLLTPSFG